VHAVKSHEIDAVIAALTAYLYMNNQTEALGDEGEEDIIIPKKITGEPFNYERKTKAAKSR